MRQTRPRVEKPGGLVVVLQGERVTAGTVQAAAAPYSKLFLSIYDLWVVRLSNDFAWNCNRDNFVDLYKQHVGHRHLEVGPGSGWALANCGLPADIDLTLLDLNENSLNHTATRLPMRTTLVQHDVLEPLPEDLPAFDSVSLNYVLHCLPGDWSTKDAAIANLSATLHPDGVLFGSTVLGVDQHYSIFGKALMEAYNRVGAFNNRRDDLSGITTVLKKLFADVEVNVVGNVALFVARWPVQLSPPLTPPR